VGRFGPDYQIDLDRQIARVRVPKPMPLDFAWLAEGVRKNNMGLAGFKLQARAAAADGKWTLQPTGQTFASRGPLPPDAGTASWRSFRVHDWGEPARTALDPLP
jgi:hypothetical protein